MRAIVQRVKSATLSVDNKLVSSIGRGILVFCAFKNDDTSENIKWTADRVANLRIFADDDYRLNLSALDVKGEALIVSNFTLYGDTSHGRRPNFSKSANSETALPMYNNFVDQIAKLLPTQTGVFGAHMQLEISADGPLTLVVEKE